MCPRFARSFFISCSSYSSCAWSDSQETKNAPVGRIACTLFRDSAGLLSRSQASSLSQRVTQCARASRGHFSFLVRRTQAALGPTHKKRKTPLWGALLVLSFVIPLGFEPRTLTLKVLCSTS